ncbi:GGDEF domain-containing protein [Siccirubricoccus deserti]
MALLLVNLDRFGTANDLHGRAAGDALLQEVAQRLRGVALAADTVARVGGDEFAVLATLRGDGRDAAAGLAGRLVAALDRPFALDSGTLRLGCSIGIALTTWDIHLPETLMRHAARALARAKAAGRGASASSMPASIPACSSVSGSRQSCAAPSAATSWYRISSQWWTWPPASSWASRCWPAGRIRRGAWCRRRSSLPWPRTSA